MSSTAEPGFDYLKDPDALLTCNICELVLFHRAGGVKIETYVGYSETFTDPVLTPCSHTFCRACVARWISEKPNGGCPKCRKKLAQSEETLRTDLRLREVSYEGAVSPKCGS